MDEILVVGAGPAGLAAALYLGRYRRRVRVIDDGRSRALLAPRAHNVPGFPEGIAGSELLNRMREQAERYGAVIETGRVVSLSQDAASRRFEAMLEHGGRLRARGVILATGIDMHLVDIADGNHEAAVRAGAIRYCPICDGYEQQDANVAVLGSDLHGAAEAMFLRRFSDRVTILPQQDVALTDRQRRELRASGIAILECKVSAIRHVGGGIAIALEGEAAPRHFDILYPALGSVPRTELARQMGIIPEADGGLAANGYREALRPGLFAAGDILSGLDQISVASGQGAMAATRLHNWLRERDGHLLSEQRSMK